MKTGIEFIETFKKSGITHNAKDKRFQDTLDFQDFIGHQNRQEIRSFYKDLDQSQKEVFIWACMHTLSFDSAVDIIKCTTVSLERERLYSDFDKDIAERELMLFHNTRELEDAKKHIYKKIRALNSEIETLNNRVAWHVTCNDTLKDSNRQLHKRLRLSESKACDFDNIRAAMALLLDESV